MKKKKGRNVERKTTKREQSRKIKKIKNNIKATGT